MPYTLPSLVSHSPVSMTIAPAWPRRLAAWLAARLGLRRPAFPPTPSEALLQELLDRHARARRVFPHLAMMESCLHQEGTAGVRRLPETARERARSELAAIANPAEAGPLLALLCERPTPPSPPASRSSAPAMEDVEVTEINEELFYEVLREWEQSQPGSGTRDNAGLPR